MFSPDSKIPFPRTKHFHNLGGATRDDLLLDKKAIDGFLNQMDIYLEEKIDGANMGLSIQNYAIVAQNRRKDNFHSCLILIQELQNRLRRTQQFLVPHRIETTSFQPFEHEDINQRV